MKPTRRNKLDNRATLVAPGTPKSIPSSADSHRFLGIFGYSNAI
jgi:hypothetical protein